MATKRGKSTKGKGKEKEISDKPCLAFNILTESQTNELIGITSPEDLEKKIQEYMKIKDTNVDIKEAAILDFYVLAFHWAKSQEFSPQQVSGFFTLCQNLLENIKEKHLNRTDNLKELKKLLAGIGIESPELTGGLDFFNVQETQKILQYISRSLFQHYSLIEYVFSKERKEEILGLDLEVETAKSASIPWPPPLDEAISEDAYNRYVRTPSPTQEPEATEAPPAETTEEVEQLEADLVNKLTADEIRAILDSVCQEMLTGFEGEVANKLREREIALLNRINKVHKVAES